jgi:polysaccharide deacetylase 2 family uncharacterized protein YibQ
MRVLFYTATAAFLILAGVFAFYAIQTPDQAGGTKVVLSIDSSEMPVSDATSSEATGERDLYAEAAARLKRIESTDAEPQAAAAEPVENDPAEDQFKTDERLSGAPEPRGDADGMRQAASDALPEDKAQSEPIPGPPPGTALAGLDNDKPIFKTLEKEAPPPVEEVEAEPEPAPPSSDYAVPGIQLGDEPAPRAEVDHNATASHRSSPAPQERDAGANTALAPQSEPKEQVDGVIASLNVKEQPAEIAAPPAVVAPPLPPKRPAGNPPPARTAALSGWGSKQISTRDAAPKSARIAILVRGLGRDGSTGSDAVSKLPSAISLGFMPFDGSSQELASKARERGHEVIVQLPLEPSDYPLNNPGPETLLSGSSADENVARLSSILSRFEGYSGVTNFLGGRLLQSKTALRPILESLKSRELIYVGEGNSHAIVRGIAGEIGLRYGGADVIIDSNPSPVAIKKALERLVALARKDGSAIGMAYASRATIDELEAWSQTLAVEGITLVPVGVLAQTPGAS